MICAICLSQHFLQVPPAEVGGVYVASTARYEEAVIAGQLQALYLSPGLHETTIGDYLNKPRNHKTCIQHGLLLIRTIFAMA